MKKYEKPMLISMELAGNEQLCGSCANQGAAVLLKDHFDIASEIVGFWGDQNGNGQADRGDFTGTNLFGVEDGCGTPVVGYCKFTGSTIVAWS